jgi:hypothetical protein
MVRAKKDVATFSWNLGYALRKPVNMGIKYPGVQAGPFHRKP